MKAMLGCQKSQTPAQICHKVLDIFSYEAIHWFVNEKLSATSWAESRVSLLSSAWLALPWPFMGSANTLLGQVPKPTMMTRITPLTPSPPSPYNPSSWLFPSISNHLPGFPSTFRVTYFLLWLFWAHCQLAHTSVYAHVCISHRGSVALPPSWPHDTLLAQFIPTLPCIREWWRRHRLWHVGVLIATEVSAVPPIMMGSLDSFSFHSLNPTIEYYVSIVFVYGRYMEGKYSAGS